MFIRASTRMTNAIEAAKGRDSFDLFARDLLVKIDDNSSSIWQRYRMVMEFLDTERPEELQSEEILNLTERAPLQPDLRHLCLGDLQPQAGLLHYVLRHICGGQLCEVVAGFEREKQSVTLEHTVSAWPIEEFISRTSGKEHSGFQVLCSARPRKTWKQWAFSATQCDAAYPSTSESCAHAHVQKF